MDALKDDSGAGTDPASKAPNAITQAILTALAKHNVGERQRNSVVANVLGLSYSQARRKLNGESEWTSTDLQTLANELGLPLADLMGDAQRSHSAAERATLMLSDQSVPCEVEIGEAVPEGGFCEFVAVGIPGAWTVWHHSQLPEGAGRGRRVSSLRITPRQDRPITIAVLDDNQASAAEVADFLNSHGLLAHAFNTAQAVREALKKTTYDGFIFDWRLSISGSETAHDLITHLRRDLNSTAPIFVLTGVDPNDEPVLNELEREITLNNIRLAFKPYKLRLLLTDLRLAVSGARQR